MPIEAQKLMRELADFFRKLSTCQSDEQILQEFPDFYTENEDPERLIDTYKKYNTEFRKFVEEKGSSELINDLHI